MTHPAISIIVPIYKAEAYLRRCVDSILSQTFEDWELLLVDDGSPDGSGIICDEYARKDSRIKVFHKPNGGVASAREVGIANATGKYSIHIDPDDWIEPNTLEALISKAATADADIVIYDFLFDYGPKHQVVSRQNPVGQDLLEALLCNKLHGSLCNKLIRTELYWRYDLHFPEKMICWEDLFICCNVALHPCKVEYIPEAFYHYDLHSNGGSMTRMATTRTLEGMKIFCEYFSKKLGPQRQSWLNEIKSTVVLTAYRCNLLDENSLRELYPEINRWFIEKYAKSYSMVMYQGLSMALSGCSLKHARRFQRLNSFYQRVKIKLNKLSR